MEYPFVLFTLVLLWHPAHGSRGETELCYIKGLDSNSNVCNKTVNVLCCHGEDPTDITVTVYRGADCYSISHCGTVPGCCSKFNDINITMEYRRALSMSFISTKCFSEVNRGTIVSSPMPNNTGLDLVVVSFNCPEPTTTSPTALPPTRDSHETTTIAVSITSSVIIILLAAIVTGICVYRRRVNTGATKQLSNRRTQSNNMHIQEPIVGNNDVNVVPPTYEQLIRQANEGEYSQIIGHKATAQTHELGSADPHSGQGQMYVNIVETT